MLDYLSLTVLSFGQALPLMLVDITSDLLTIVDHYVADVCLCKYAHNSYVCTRRSRYREVCSLRSWRFFRGWGRGVWGAGEKPAFRPLFRHARFFA